MLADTLTNWQSYKLGSAWEAVFAFLEGVDADAEVGEYPILGDLVFARVLEYTTKEDASVEAVLEAHRKFADVHMTLVGAERIALYPSASLEVKAAYDPARDVEFYNYKQLADWQLAMRPGSFILLLPQDAHMTGLFVDEPGTVVKKVVVKIAMELLEI
jgi:YhcH/YjgK/YiaL family protein